MRARCVAPVLVSSFLCCLWSAPITHHPFILRFPLVHLVCLVNHPIAPAALLQSGSCPRCLRNPYPDRRCLGSNRPETARATVDSSSAPHPLTLSAVLTKSKALRSQPDETHVSAPTNANKRVDYMQCFAGGLVGLQDPRLPSFLASASCTSAAPRMHLD